MVSKFLAAFGIAATTVLTQSPQTNTAPAASRHMPEYTQSGDLILPKNWRSWVFIGSPLTPDGLNDSKENFPEFHNVYIEPASFDIYKKTGMFPEGTILFKELQRTLKHGQFPDGSRVEPSGRGYFPAAYNGADVTVKDSKRYAATGGGVTTTSITLSPRLLPRRCGLKLSVPTVIRRARRKTKSGLSSIPCWINSSDEQPRF
jgi:hypothetical protein